MTRIDGPRCTLCGRFIPPWRAPGFDLSSPEHWTEGSIDSSFYPEWLCRDCQAAADEEAEDDDDTDDSEPLSHEEAMKTDPGNREEVEYQRREQAAEAAGWSDWAGMAISGDGVYPDDDSAHEEVETPFMYLRGLGIHTEGS